MTSTNRPGQPYRMEPVPPGEMDDWGRINATEGIDLYGTRAIPQNGQPVHDRCGQPLRWSTAYDEPHWVHTSAAAVMACPPMRGTL